MRLNCGDTAPRTANYKVVSPEGEIIGNVLGTLETNDMTAQEALDEIQAQLEEADLL